MKRIAIVPVVVLKKLFLIICIISSFLYSCEKEKEDPSVTMVSAMAVTGSSGKAVARVDQTGDYPVIDHGFVYIYTNSNYSPEINFLDQANKLSLGSVMRTDTFSAILPLTTDVYPNDFKWKVWAYITNEKGTVYSSKPVIFFPKEIRLESVSPLFGEVGDTITLYGNNFETSISNIQVKFYINRESDYVLATVVSASETAIKIKVPDLSKISSFDYGSLFSIQLNMGKTGRTLYNAFVLQSFPTGFLPKQGTFNTLITISGTQMDNISAVMIGNTIVYADDRSSTSVVFSVPFSMKQKKSKIYVVKGNAQIEVPGGEFEMLPLTVSSVYPMLVRPGDLVEVTGSNFNRNYDNGNIMKIGSTQLWSSYESESSSSFYIPGNIAAGEYPIRISNGVDTVLMPDPLTVVVPSITNISSASVYPGDLLTITGHNFNDLIYIDGDPYGYDFSYSKHDSVSFEIEVPSLRPGTHTVEMRANNQFYNEILSSKVFTVLEPTLTSITPTSGAVGTSFIINGRGFGKNSFLVGVMFGNVSATVLFVTGTQITVRVPENMDSGTWTVSVTVNGLKLSDTLEFTIP
ncbi:MAG TPA: IPT/TIG domain-containing protein [Bacteroidales bacterium]|nr:IPT/TIG domain-containing protein [Bacteroidales bacterium]